MDEVELPRWWMIVLLILCSIVAVAPELFADLMGRIIGG